MTAQEPLPNGSQQTPQALPTGIFLDDYDDNERRQTETFLNKFTGIGNNVS
jgi:hypothetical protein